MGVRSIVVGDARDFGVGVVAKRNVRKSWIGLDLGWILGRKSWRVVVGVFKGCLIGVGGDRFLDGLERRERGCDGLSWEGCSGEAEKGAESRETGRCEALFFVGRREGDG